MKLNGLPPVTPKLNLVHRPAAPMNREHADQVQLQEDRHQPSPEGPPPSPTNWPTVLGVAAVTGTLAGLSVSGMGLDSSISAFITGGLVGGGLIAGGLNALVSGPAGGGTGAGLAGDIGSALGGIAGGLVAGGYSARLALQYGNPTLGLWLGLATAGATAYALARRD